MNFFILFSVLSTQYFLFSVLSTQYFRSHVAHNSSKVKTAMLEWSLECIKIEEYRKMKMIALVDSKYFTSEWFDVNTLRVSNGVCGVFLDQIMIMIIYFSMWLFRVLMFRSSIRQFRRWVLLSTCYNAWCGVLVLDFQW